MSYHLMDNFNIVSMEGNFHSKETVALNLTGKN